MRARHSTLELRLQFGLGLDVRGTETCMDFILNFRQYLGLESASFLRHLPVHLWIWIWEIVWVMYIMNRITIRMDNISIQYNIAVYLHVIIIHSHIKILNLVHSLGGLVASMSRCGER